MDAHETRDSMFHADGTLIIQATSTSWKKNPSDGKRIQDPGQKTLSAERVLL